MKIVFFGTPAFAATILDKLIESNVHVQAIVTKPDRPQGRTLQVLPCPVKVLATNKLPQVPVFQPEKCSTAEFAETLRQFDADLFVVAAYGEIVSQEILDIPRLSSINVHASLLPKYRGAAPIHRAIINDEKESGICIIQMVKKMDAGDILYSEKVPISQNMTFQELEDALSLCGARCVLKVIDDFAKGQVRHQPQDPEKATFAPKITSDECKIDWSRENVEVHNLIRGTSPHPGAWCIASFRKAVKRLKILQSELVNELQGAPGSIIQANKNSLVIGCGRGSVRLLKVQLEGKPVVTVADLLKGYPVTEISFQV